MSGGGGQNIDKFNRLENVMVLPHANTEILFHNSFSLPFVRGRGGVPIAALPITRIGESESRNHIIPAVTYRNSDSFVVNNILDRIIFFVALTHGGWLVVASLPDRGRSGGSPSRLLLRHRDEALRDEYLIAIRV